MHTPPTNFSRSPASCKPSPSTDDANPCPAFVGHAAPLPPKPPAARSVGLPLDTHRCVICLVAFVLHYLRSFRAERLLIGIFRRLPMPSHDFGATLNANHPVRFSPSQETSTRSARMCPPL